LSEISGFRRGVIEFSLFSDVTQHIFVYVNRLFGTTLRSHL
jgi:hypothetical protein